MTDDEQHGGFLPPRAGDTPPPPPAPAGPPSPFAPPVAATHPAFGGPPPAPAQRSALFWPVAERADTVVAWLWVALVANVLVVLTNIPYAITLQGAIDDPFDNGAVDTAEAFEIATLVAAILWLIAVVGCAVATIRWLRAARHNVELLGARNVRYGTTMAGWAWFIPFASAWIPKQIINDAWRGADPAGGAQPDAQMGELPGIFLAWWLLFLVSGTGGAAPGGFNNADDYDELQTDAILTVPFAAGGVVAAYLGMRVVRMIAARQRERASAIGAPDPG